MTFFKSCFLIVCLVGISVLPAFNLHSQGTALLWKVKHENGPSYLLGSVHVLKKEHYPLKQVIEDAYAASDILAVEADLSGEKGMTASMKMLQKAFYTDDTTIEDHLDKKVFDQLQAKLKELKLNYDSLKNQKPWMLAMTLLMHQLTKLGFDPGVGVDMHFLNKANKDKKKIIELESVDFQLELFESLTKVEGEQFLLTTIKEANTLEKEFDKIIQSWLNGDVAALEKLLLDETLKSGDAAKLYKRINDDRNVKMVEKIDGLFQSGKTCFIVVGGAHMVGPMGIVQLLKQKGHTVTQL